MLIRQFHKRNLPHLYYNEGIYFVTYRLYGSIPSDKLSNFKRLQRFNTDRGFKRYKEIIKAYDSLLDKPTNQIRYLKRPDVMQICKSTIHFYDGELYNIICYCIMPNHIHFVFELLSENKTVGSIMGSIKKFSGENSNILLKQTGPFWQAESFDRLVRDDVELYFTIKYTLLNPVNAGLVKDWKNWEGTYCPEMYQVID